MSRKSKINAAKIASLLLVVPALIIAHSIGPLPRNTGAPGDRTCARTGMCHVGTENTGPGKIEILSGSNVYVPGTRHSLAILITDPDAQRYGFQATARPNSDLQFSQAGRFETVQQNTFVLCENGVLRIGADSCPDVTPVEFIEHNADQESPQFVIDWVAPATDIGDVTIYAAGNAAAAPEGPLGDRIYTTSLTLSPVSYDGPPVIRDAQPVLQAFDNSERLSPNSYIQIFGQKLAATSRGWAAADFDPGLEPGATAPAALDGVEVIINNRNAFISYVSGTQVNAVVPDGVGEGPMTVMVRHGGGESNRVAVTTTAVSPALQQHPLWVQGGKNFVVALPAGGGGYIGPPGMVAGVSTRPAAPNETIILYAVGCGPTEPAAPTGVIPGLTPSNDVYRLPESSFEIRFGDTDAPADGFLAPEFIGLYQFNVTVPNMAPGDHPITLTVNGIENGQDLYTTVGQ